MNRDYKYLLISDSYHPEVRHIARYLAESDQKFLYVSGLVFRERKNSPKLRIKHLQNIFLAFYLKRSIPLGKFGKLVTTGRIFDLLFFSVYRNILRVPGYCYAFILEFLKRRWTIAITNRAQANIQGEPKIIISLGDWDISPREVDTLVTIMFHGDSRLENVWREEAVRRWPSWSETWRISEREEDIFRNFNRVEVHASSFTANLTKVVSCTKKYEPTKVVVPIAPVTKNSKGVLFKTYSDRYRRKVLFLGSWTLRKGLPDLLAAYKTIDIENRPELYIAGSGKMLNLQEIDNLKLESEIFFINSPNSGQVEELFELADILILPSYYEGFGIVILEAMSFGLIPVVSRNTAGPDIVANSELSNFLINPGDIKMIRENLLKLNRMTNEDLERLGRLAFDLAADFDFENYGETVISTIFDELEKPGNNSPS